MFAVSAQQFAEREANKFSLFLTKTMQTEYSVQP